MKDTFACKDTMSSPHKGNFVEHMEKEIYNLNLNFEIDKNHSIWSFFILKKYFHHE